MASEFTQHGEPDQDPDPPITCHIRVKGHLGLQWSDWFEGLAITVEDNGETLLAGQVVDQSALHGLLRKVRDIGIPLLSVVCCKPDGSEATEPNVAELAVIDLERQEGGNA